MEIVLNLWEALLLMIISIVILALACRKIRQQFPVRVHCWFCHTYSRVPYGNRNCWDCPHCDQYNGFTLDGDYNKPVPAQYTEDINHPVSCQPAEFLTRGSFLCPTCQRNQLLKFKQLAAFEPLNEAAYDEEISFYKRHLEKVYALCPSCDTFVKRELERLDDSLNRQHDVSRDVPFPPDSCDEAESTRAVLSAVRALQWLTSVVTLSTSLCTALLVGVGVDSYRNWLSGQATNRVGSYSRSDGILGWLTGEMTDRVDRLGVGLCGLVLCLFSKLLHGKHRVHLGDAIHILLWVGVVGVGMWLSPSPHLAHLPHLLHLALPVVTLALELFLACRHRRLSSATSPIIRRLPLEAGGSGASSDAASDAVSSVSTSCRHRFKSPFLDSELKSPFLDNGVRSPFLDSGDGLGVPALNTVSSEQQPPAGWAPPQGLLANGTCGTTKKDSDLDTLWKGLGAVQISSPSSESGYSTGRSSVFSSNAFGPMTQPSLSSGVPFPRPLICSPKLSVVSCSQAGSGRNPAMTSKASQPSLLDGGVKEPAAVRPGHANPFLLHQARPRSMFPSRTPGTTLPTVPHFMSKYQTSSGSSTLVFTLNDLRTAHLQASPLTTPRTRSQTKACSEVDFPWHGVNKSGRAMSEVDFPWRGVNKSGRAMSEVDFPWRGVSKSGRAMSEVDFPWRGVSKSGRAMSEVDFPWRGVSKSGRAMSEVDFPWRGVSKSGRAMSELDFPLRGFKKSGRAMSEVDFPRRGVSKSGRAMSEVDFPWRGVQKSGRASSEVDFPLLTVNKRGRASSEVGFPRCGVTPDRSRSLTTWWRASSSDLRQDQPASGQVTSSHTVFSKDHDFKGSAIDSTPQSETSSPVECDSTTPLLSQLKISTSPKKRKKKKTGSKPQLVNEVAADSFFVVSDDDNDEEEEEEGQIFHPTNQSTVSTVVLQPKQDWGWLQWVAVGVMVFSVCTNLFLSWTVWASRS